MSPLAWLLVALGGAAGSLARVALGLAVTRLAFPPFPWGTLAVNILGSFAIGAAAARLTSPDWRAFTLAGLCGGFTTFSSFSLQTIDLARAGHTALAAANIALSVGLCLLATLLGHAVA